MVDFRTTAMANNRFGWHSGNVRCRQLFVDKEAYLFSTLNFGDAIADNWIVKGRIASGTAAGSALDLGASYAYGEAVELRYTISNWTGIGSSFKALYLRSEADLGGAYGLRCAEFFGVMDTSTTTGLSSLQTVYSEMLVKASASNRTLTNGHSVEANISVENQTGTLTLTNNIYCLYAKAQTGTGINDYTKVNGIKISGRDDGTARVFGNALDICDPEATVCSWTTGISLSTACATGLSISGACSTAVVQLGSSGTPLVNDTAAVGFVVGYFDCGATSGWPIGAWFTTNVTGAGGSFTAVQGDAVLTAAKATVTGIENWMQLNTGGRVTGSCRSIQGTIDFSNEDKGTGGTYSAGCFNIKGEGSSCDVGDAQRVACIELKTEGTFSSTGGENFQTKPAGYAIYINGFTAGAGSVLNSTTLTLSSGQPDTAIGLRVGVGADDGSGAVYYIPLIPAADWN